MLDEYYREADITKRGAMLEIPMPEVCEGEEREQVKKLFELRYTKDNKDRYVDRFLRAWMDLLMLTKDSNGIFLRRSRQRSFRKVMQELCLEEQTKFLREVLYREMCHLAMTYVMACQRDGTYQSVILGIGKISDEKLRRKITAELEDIRQCVIRYSESDGVERVLAEAIAEVEDNHIYGASWL